MPFYYIFYGLKTKSDLELSVGEKWNNFDDSEVDVEIKGDELSFEWDYYKKNIARYVERNLDSLEGSPHIKFYCHTDNRFCVANYVHRVALFSIENGTSIKYHPFVNTDDEFFRQWLICFAFAAIYAQRKKILIHGSGLLPSVNANGIIVCGESGAGKSTIANELLKRNYLFVSDDAVPIYSERDKTFLLGSYMQRRLCNDVVEADKLDKASLIHFDENNRSKWAQSMSHNYYSEPQKIGILFALKLGDDFDGVIVKEISGFNKVPFLFNNVYRLDLHQDIGLGPEINGEILRMAGNVRIFEISRPKEKDTVEEIVSIIMDIVHQNVI